MTAAAQSTGRAAAPYKPRAGSIADRAVDHLQSLPDGVEVMTTALAQAIHCPALTLTPCLEAPLQQGMIFRRQRDTHPRSPWWWSATDHSAKPAAASAAPRSDSAQPDIAESDEILPPDEPPKRPSLPVEKPEARIGLRGKTAALWLTGELAFEADDGTVIVFEPALVQRMAKFLLPIFEAEA